ncbi:divalent metal cation transporter [Rhodohalobacter sp. SW132]|uniref:Nramp family divalent metal transporter n=1 Tax=Rhodohalobacter sp. SW132 TaxID=2293433 RepID=UPI000E2357A0|nr:Nramp family divalent metal transporter [Rhodohalobacter sp. SW132]REL39271.1 divalent metal cation transporter [Rhodohalobacter sp. SW132]
MSSNLKKSLGPGLLMAAAAIGVSHLVQSTRAGAEFGYALIWAVLLANLFKYPFLEFGPRYAIATGRHMIDGYKKLGSWAIWIFILFTTGTMFAIQAAVTVVTASLAAELTGIALSPGVWSAIILAICLLFLFKNSYAVLDGVIKLFIVVLAVSTLIAVCAALFKAEPSTTTDFLAPEIWTVSGVAFLIALMGWMPIPIDASVWHSIWTLERSKQTHYTPTLRESLTDFNIGYLGAALFAVGFLVLGAQVMYGTGQAFAPSAALFSQQLISLYTQTLGEWSYLLITICAFSTMFSTTFTVTDTYPRVCSLLIRSFKSQEKNDSPGNLQYRVLLITISLGSLSFLLFMGDRFRLMIDLATTLSFLTAPILAFINYRLIFHSGLDEKYRPPAWLKLLAICGLLFLTGFAIFYVYWMTGF